jgi:2-oxo-4-hydroxy-4-carboxy--5-ureidoimidazoline (OHCU) decarboxylase
VPGIGGSIELSEWMAWTGIRGDIDPIRSDVRAAMIAQVTAASHGAKGTKLKSFMPYAHLAEKVELTPEQEFEQAIALFRAVPKKIEKK